MPKKILLVIEIVSQSFLLANLQFNSGSGKQALGVVPVWQLHQWHLENELLSFSLISSEYITKNPFSAYILVPTNHNCLWIIRDAFVQMMLPQKQMVVIASSLPQHRNQTLHHKPHFVSWGQEHRRRGNRPRFWNPELDRFIKPMSCSWNIAEKCFVDWQRKWPQGKARRAN